MFQFCTVNFSGGYGTFLFSFSYFSTTNNSKTCFRKERSHCSYVFKFIEPFGNIHRKFKSKSAHLLFQYFHAQGCTLVLSPNKTTRAFVKGRLMHHHLLQWRLRTRHLPPRGRLSEWRSSSAIVYLAVVTNNEIHKDENAHDCEAQHNKNTFTWPMKSHLMRGFGLEAHS